jgi:hypothetical protein
MQLLSGEFILLILLLFIAVRVKAKIPMTERLLRGLQICYPPSYEELRDKPNLADRFNISFVSIDDSFSRKSSYFAEADFLLVLTAVSFFLSYLSIVLKDSSAAFFEHSVSFYLLLTVVLLCTFGVYSQLVKGGLLSADNYMAFMLGLVVFSLCSILLTMEHAAFLDFNFLFSVKLLNKRLTYAAQHFSNSTVDLDYTSFMICLVGCVSLMTLPYFRFVIRHSLNASISETLDKEGAWKKTNLVLSMAPVLLILLWIKPMTKHLVVPDYMGEGTYEYVRLSLVVAVMIGKLVMLRNDVQGFLNQAQGVIYTVILDPSREGAANAAFQVKALASYAWSFAHQALCSYILPLTLCFLLLYKVDLSRPYPQPLKEATELPPLEIDTEEFLVSESFNPQAALIMPSRAKFYYPELRDLELLIQEAATNRTQQAADKELKSTMQQVTLVIRKGLIPDTFYRDLLEFALWQYCLVWAVGTIFSLVYSRRFGSTKAKVG